MGEAKRKRSTTAKFIEKYPYCYFCGGTRAATTREHMPPKALFDNSHRPDKLVMPACALCNSGTSTADLTAAIVSRWHYGDDDAQERLDHKKLTAQIRNQAPAIIAEWTQLNGVGRKKARQHLRNYGVPVPLDAGVVSIGPETIKQLNLFAHKASLALYFEHFRKPFPAAGKLCAFWKTKEDFARDGIPPLLLEILRDYGTLTQGQWDARETFEYRHSINANLGLFGFLARLRRGLFVVGFLATDAAVLPSESELESLDWLNPADPQTLLDLPRFTKKL